VTRVLVVDNYDSFTYNLVQYLGELGAEVEVVRNDHAPVDELLERRPDRVVVSPGPCTPDEAGVSVEVVRRFPEAGVPTLGVCLGHQSLAQAFGGAVVRHLPVHGKTTTIEHDGRTIYSGLPAPLTVGRYHSLVVDPDALPDVFEISSEGGGVVMGIRHRELPAEGVQFHPESVLTDHGKTLLQNFLRPRPRPAGPEDCEEVHAITRAAHGGDPIELDEVRRRLGAEGSFALVAVGVGVVAAQPADEPGVRHVWAMHVVPEHQGSGLASEFLRAAIADAAARGDREVLLWAPADRPRAQRFYAREGFRPAGEPFDSPVGRLVELRRPTRAADTH